MEEKPSREKVFFSLFWVYLETISTQAVTFIVTIILARLLTPNDYGIIALVTVFVNIANVFVTSSFSYALIQKKDADDLDYQSMFWFNLIISLLLFVILFILSPAIALYYEMPILSPVLRILSIKIPLSAYNSIQLAKVSHEMKFKKTFISTSGSALISAGIGVFLAYKGFGVWALVAQVLSIIIFNTLLLSTIIKWRPKFIFSFDRLLPLINFGWKLLATGLMFSGYSEISKLIIGKRYSSNELGYFDKGSQFPHFIASNVDNTINRVLFPTLSKQQDDSNRLMDITRRSAKTSAFIMTPILFGLAITAPVVVHLLLTDKWMPCVPFVQIMCFSWWMQPTQSCSVQGIKAIGRSDVYLKVEIISKICGLILLFLAVFIFNTAIAIAISMLCAQVLSMILYAFFSEKLLGYKMLYQFRDLFACGAIGLIMILVIYLLSQIRINDLCLLILQISMGTMIYLGLASLFKLEAFSYLLKVLRKKCIR